MWTAIIGALSSVIGVGGDWLKGKQAIAAAKVEREVKALTHESNWDEVQAENAGKSWKDEWLTILISIPLIMCFIPGLESFVERGFEVLETMPEWYQYLVGVVFAASFGIKAVTSKFGKK